MVQEQELSQLHIGTRFQFSMSTRVNRFASELLVPTDFLRQDLDDITLDVEDQSQIERLAKRYKVSVTMMTIRINRYFDKDIFE